MPPIGPSAIDSFLASIFNKAQAKRFIDAMVPVLGDAALASAAETAAALGLDPTLLLTNPTMERLLSARLPKVVGNVNRVTKQRLRNQLLTVIAQGGSLKDQALAVRSVMKSASKFRAITIARTETGIFTSTGGHEQAKMLGAKAKIWLTSRDADVRDSHGIDGQCQAHDEPFVLKNGVLMAHPHDPTGPPEEVINCRCVESPETTPCDARGTRYTEQYYNLRWRYLIRQIEQEERKVLAILRREFRQELEDLIAELLRLGGE